MARQCVSVAAGATVENAPECPVTSDVGGNMAAGIRFGIDRSPPAAVLDNRVVLGVLPQSGRAKGRALS
jgi:hypothetical protein